GYLFPSLQGNPQKMLKQDPTTVGNLIALGSTMCDTGLDGALNSKIPSVYTYFSQFVAHDLSFESFSQNHPLNGALEPLSVSAIKSNIRNQRTGLLDLDCVYEPTAIGGVIDALPREVGQPEKLLIDRAVETSTGFPPGVDPNHSDLPRRGYNKDKKLDRTARIGDVRNDDNLILSQLHLSFLRAHNRLVGGGRSFVEAQQLLRQHYQWIVVDDFLTRVADPNIVQDFRNGAAPIFNQSEENFFLPLEFTVAAFRFGHSMVRPSYNYNSIFELKLRARLFRLFRAVALSNYHHILDSWIIQWDRFVDGGTNVARLMDTRLVDPLTALIDAQGIPLKFEGRLAVRDLLRGYLLRIPTGQAVAEQLNCEIIPAAELVKVAGSVSDEQKRILMDPQTDFSNRTPLWFYILAEAAIAGTGRLGCVGSRLVAGVLIGLIRHNPNSILTNFTPSLGPKPGKFDRADLLRFAGVLK